MKILISLYIYMGVCGVCGILVAYHYLCIVEIFVGSVLLAGLLAIYKIVITRT